MLILNLKNNFNNINICVLLKSENYKFIKLLKIKKQLLQFQSFSKFKFIQLNLKFKIYNNKVQV